MNIDHTVTIAATAESIWPLLADPERSKEWNPDVVESTPRSSGPPQPGLISDVKIREGGRVVDYQEEITALEPPTHLALTLSGGSLGASPMRVAYRLEPAGHCATVRYTATWKARGLMLRLLAPVLTAASRRNARVTMARLKRVAEEISGAGAGT